MITYAALHRSRSAFVSLTGLTPEAFDSLYSEFAPVHQDCCQRTRVTKRHRQPRRRVVGGGRQHDHSLQDRLLMALFWLRTYPTYEVTGFFFSLNKTNAEDNVKDILRTLESMTDFSFERPTKDRKKLRSPQAVMDAFPDVRLVIDAKEQRLHRPKSDKDNNNQKPYYSGKKKAHTLKNQIAVQPDGKIAALSRSVPGGANHDLTLLRTSKLLESLDPEDEAAMMDKGYDGIQKDYPNHRLYLPFKARRNRPLTEEQKAYNRHLSRYRIVVEHTIAQLNQFQVLAQVFRHARSGHSDIIRVVAMLVNRRIQLRPLKTYSVGALA